MSDRKKAPEPFSGLVDTLELLVAQARAYERALPLDNYPARAAVVSLGELARQALNDARDLRTSLETAPMLDHTLSPREMEVLGLAAKGLTNKEIAYRLGISDRMVQFHMDSIFNKTCTNSRTEAVALAVRSGWLAPNPSTPRR
ncbi:LuxR C-terminal-related transcriptional regulator [Chloroflexota bacterium]